ncbi:MAG TPA: XRE family transcriptional regulator [Chloroflexota bacterium]|nr:XRE family transcriptional regulator [Chloroflexota bacterium]
MTVARRRTASTHPSELGGQLREERLRQHIGLRELAKRLSISPSLLSQIETGKSKPSVGTLYAIADALNISLDNLFFDARPAASPPSIGRSAGDATPNGAAPPPATGPVQRTATRKVINLESGVRWELLTPTSDPAVEFLSIVYDVGGSSSQNGTLMRHTGREYGLVLSGQLSVTIGFETYELGPGDSICFDSTSPHRLWNTGNEPVHAIWFVVHR